MKTKQIKEMAEVINSMDERNAHYYDKHMQECEAFADGENIAKALYAADYRKKSDIIEEIFGEIEKLLDIHSNAQCYQGEVFVQKYFDGELEEAIVRLKDKMLNAKRYFEIALANYDEENVPYRVHTVHCSARKPISREDAAAFCRDELGLYFESVFSIEETTLDDVLEYIENERDIPSFD